MTTESKEQFLAERVRALATVVLTRRGDLTFLDTRKNIGLDLHVHIEREDKAGRGSGVFPAGRGREWGTNPESKRAPVVVRPGSSRSV